LTESAGQSPTYFSFLFQLNERMLCTEKTKLEKGITRQLGPKEKNMTLQVVVSPKTKFNFPRWFGFGTHQAKLVSKLSSP
jgi:hypothetical protein